MTLQPDHQQVIDLLEQYLLGTLDAPEQHLVELHLADGCRQCQDRLAELEELSVLLASAVPQQQPPVSVWTSVAKRVEAESPDRTPMNGEQTPTAGFWMRNVVPWAAATAVAAALVLMVLQNRELQSKLDQTSLQLDSLTERAAKLSGDLQRYEDATLLLGQPGMQFVDLTGVDPNPQAFGKVVLDPDKGTGIVYMYRMPKSPEGTVYQLWGLREGKPTAMGAVTVAEDGSAVLKLDSSVDPAMAMAFEVTIESAGSQVPTGMLYLTGQPRN